MRQQSLDDLDPMPWGKHQNTPMQDVPASYFHYLWNNGLKNKVRTDPVAAYIQRNLAALKQEHTDGIWD